jgi:NitT/TauT family transport system ATP-binding protein
MSAFIINDGVLDLSNADAGASKKEPPHQAAWEERVSAGLAKAVVARTDRELGGEASALTVKKVGLAFGAGRGRPVLDDISFDVREGELLCIVGPSGCGKTTLLRLLAGLLRPSSGDILFDGETINGPSRSRAIIFQDYSNALLPWRTVSGNVSLSLEAGGVSRDERDSAINLLLAKMGLLQAADQYPSQLSGGMQQRVQIARCLAQQPKILLMDEPFGALDAITRQTLQDELLQIAAERAMTVVFITHDLEEAIYLGDRVFVLGTNPGRIIETIQVDLPRPRNQLTTREDWRFLAHRHRLFGLLQGH